MFIVCFLFCIRMNYNSDVHKSWEQAYQCCSVYSLMRLCNEVKLHFLLGTCLSLRCLKAYLKTSQIHTTGPYHFLLIVLEYIVIINRFGVILNIIIITAGFQKCYTIWFLSAIWKGSGSMVCQPASDPECKPCRVAQI